jgi:hypothetical protein
LHALLTAAQRQNDERFAIRAVTRASGNRSNGVSTSTVPAGGVEALAV